MKRQGHKVRERKERIKIKQAKSGCCSTREELCTLPDEPPYSSLPIQMNMTPRGIDLRLRQNISYQDDISFAIAVLISGEH